MKISVDDIAFSVVFTCRRSEILDPSNRGESFPSPDGIPSRQSRLGPFLWFVQNRWEKFWGIIGGMGSGSWSAVKVRPGWSSTELFTRDASRHFPHLIIISCFSASALQCFKTNWSPIIACPDLTTSSRDQSINKASLVAIMVIAVALVDVSGGRTTWWRTEACCQKSWMCWMQFSEGYWIICLH